MATTTATRSKDSVYLIGNVSGDFIMGSKLPTIGQSLSFFFYKHNEEKLTIRESASATVDEINKMWVKANVPTCQKKHGITRLEKLFKTWVTLRKGDNRGGATQIAKEREFQEDLGKTFDIRHQDWNSLVVFQEDRDFLIDQFCERKATMGPLDKKFERQEKNRQKRKTDEINRKIKESERLEISECCNEAEDSAPSSTESVGSEFEVSRKPKKKRPKNIISADVAASFDRTKLTDRMAVHTMAAISKAHGLNPSDLVLNKWSVNRKRRSHRVDLLGSLKGKISADIEGILVVHWDGKLIPDLTGHASLRKVERLPIIVSSSFHEQLLNVPALVSGTGQAIADAVVDALEEWKIKENVKAMSFDTTASNTGVRAGAAVLIEEKLNKELLHLACRHHIFEVILADVFKCLFDYSSGPEIAIFKRFQGLWRSIDADIPESGMLDEETAIILENNQEMKSSAMDYAMKECEKSHLREDYRELLELSIIYLGGEPPRGRRIRKPGAMHHARWMAKAIYAFKIFLFRAQFKLTMKEERALRYFNLLA